MLRKDHCLPVNAKLVKYSLINNRNWLHIMSDVTLHVDMIPLTAEDRLPVKTSQTEKRWIVEKNDC